MQGCRASTLISAESEMQHTHDRKALSAFFNQENISSVVDCLIKQVGIKCRHVARCAAQQPDGATTLDMARLATQIVAAIVQEVRSCPRRTCTCLSQHCASSCNRTIQQPNVQHGMFAKALSTKKLAVVPCAYLVMHVHNILHA